MSQSISQLQSKLPTSIRLFRHAPDRRKFLWESLDPSQVRVAEDLPPYLILGELDVDSFVISAGDWSALWKGTELDTHFEVRYLADEGRYKLNQTWHGINGGYSTFSSKIPLDKLILQSLYMQFPSSWDAQAKEEIENKFQITYFEQPDNSAILCGMPDGVFRTIAFPVSIKNFRPVRQWLQEIIIKSSLQYPISAQLKLMSQAINYIEGKADEWTTTPPVVFNHSLNETGVSPYAFPVRETAQDGSSAWTLHRDLYILLISLPFAGLTDFLERISAVNGPIRNKTDPVLRIELQPIVMPAAYEFQTQGITLWDQEQTTRCIWLFAKEGEKIELEDIQDIIHSESVADDSLRAAERISEEVTEEVEQLVERVLAGK